MREWTEKQRLCFTPPYECGINHHPQGYHHSDDFDAAWAESRLSGAHHDLKHALATAKGVFGKIARVQEEIKEYERILLISPEGAERESN